MNVNYQFSSFGILEIWDETIICCQDLIFGVKKLFIVRNNLCLFHKLTCEIFETPSGQFSMPSVMPYFYIWLQYIRRVLHPGPAVLILLHFFFLFVEICVFPLCLFFMFKNFFFWSHFRCKFKHGSDLPSVNFSVDGRGGSLNLFVI